MVRLVFLAILCLEGALPYGGQIAITCENGRWSLLGTADKLNMDASLWSVLADPSEMDQIEPAHVQFALLPTLVRDEGLTLQTDIGSTSVEIRF